MTGPNDEQSEYWNATAGPKWVEHQEKLDAQLRPLGEMVIARLGDLAGKRVLDVGCGCGDHTLAVAERAASAVGLDVSQPMLARAKQRAARRANVMFLKADAQTRAFMPEFDVITSRFGVMFFSDFAAAFTNLRKALAPDGRLAFVCWQPIEKNPWMLLPLQVAGKFVELPPPAPAGTPGPFGLDDPERIRRALGAAGFSGMVIDAVDAPQNVGGAKTLEDAVQFFLVAGPASSALKGTPPDLRARVADALRPALAPFVTDRGVVMPGAAFIVTARNG